jgi:hypothetical protein
VIYLRKEDGALMLAKSMLDGVTDPGVKKDGDNAG